MRTLALVILLALSTQSAFAHAADAEHAAFSWNLDGFVVVPLIVSAAMYVSGFVAIRRRASEHWRDRAPQALLYLAGWLTLAGALVSPLHWLGEHVFTFHMIEHEIVMAVSAPLLVLSRPLGILLWALPKSGRLLFGRAWRAAASGATRVGLTRPTSATVIHGAAIWIWHAPQFFDAAVADEWVHRLQHLSFFLTALLFWWAMLRRASYGVATWHLFVTMIHTSVLGALIALAPTVLYAAQTVHALAFGLTPLEDQQLAGVVMWVPAGTIYAGATLLCAARWISWSGSRQVRGPRHVVDSL
jgi:putative membrane protein